MVKWLTQADLAIKMRTISLSDGHVWHRVWVGGGASLLSPLQNHILVASLVPSPIL